MQFHSVNPGELAPGQPLPWNLFDGERNRLMRRGEVIADESRLVELTRTPLFRDEAPSAEPDPHEVGHEFAFDDMQLRVGVRLQLKLPLKLGGGFKIVQLIGYIENRFLFVSAPDYGVGEAPLIEGDPVEARVFGGQTAFSFPCHVDRIVKLPVVYLLLTFPHRIFGKTVRKGRRVRTRLPAMIESAAGTLEGVITNLSTGGAELLCQGEPGKLNDILSLGFSVTAHGVVSQFRIRAAIRSLAGSSGGEAAARVGVEFQELSGTESYQLKGFIYQELVERPRAAVG